MTPIVRGLQLARSRWAGAGGAWRRVLAAGCAAVTLFAGAACSGAGADVRGKAEGGGAATAGVERATEDSLVARAMSANAREQSRAEVRGAASPRSRLDAPATAGPSGTATDADRAATTSATRPRPPFGASVGFRSPTRLDEHYIKHGAEFGQITRDAYLRQAQALRDAPLGGSVLEIARGDGTLSRFDRSSGSFVAFDADGIIRTFFRPNDGENYFRRQARRRVDR